MDLQDLKIIGSEGNMTEFIYFIDPEGQDAGVSYSWLSPDMSGEEDFCWFDIDNWERVEDFTVTDGMGFFIFTDAGNVKIQAAGSVKLGKYSKVLAAGYNLTGNFTPVEIDVQNLKIVGSEGNMTEFIYFIDAEGQDAGISYSWLSPDMSGEEEFCWFDIDNWEPVEGCTVKPGEALFMFADEGGVSYELPAVL